MVDPSFFGLSGHPFSTPSSSSDSHCLADEHLALTTELHAGLKAPHGITLLIGDEGAGKSTFIRNFVAQLPDSFVVAYLPTAGPGLRHLLTEAVEQLGGTVVPGGGEQALIDVLRSLARARAEHDRATLVVIDDAHELPAKTIERLGKLFGTDPAEPSRLHVTLVGRPELLDRMNAANDRSILKHLVQVCRMDAIGPEDAFRYIADRVQKVGGIVDRLFTEEALRLIVQRANGNPARIDQICSAALERAADRGAHSVDTDAVDVACTGETPVGNMQTSMAGNEPPETPTYFFSEEEEESTANGSVADTTPRELTTAGAGVAAAPVVKAAMPSPVARSASGGTSRRRLAFWAAGAIAVVAAFAGMMTLPERTALDPSIGAGAKAPMESAKAERAAGKETPDAGSLRKIDGEQKAPTAVPKLVVRRNGDGPNGARAGGRKDKARANEPQDAPGAAGAVVASAGDAAKAGTEPGVDRPRFQAPPFGSPQGSPPVTPATAATPPGAATPGPPPSAAAPQATGQTPPASAPPAAPTAAPAASTPTPATAPAAVAGSVAAPAVSAAPSPIPTPAASAVTPPSPAANTTTAAKSATPPKPAPGPVAVPAKPSDAGLVAPTRSPSKPAVAAAAPSKPTPPIAAAPKPAATATASAAAATATTGGGPYTIQVGAFASRANAEALVAKIRASVPDGKIVASTADGKPVFRVVVGSFPSPAAASPRMRELSKAGVSTFVRRVN